MMSDFVVIFKNISVKVASEALRYNIRYKESYKETSTSTRQSIMKSVAVGSTIPYLTSKGTLLSDFVPIG